MTTGVFSLMPTNSCLRFQAHRPKTPAADHSTAAIAKKLCRWVAPMDSECAKIREGSSEAELRLHAELGLIPWSGLLNLVWYIG